MSCDICFKALCRWHGAYACFCFFTLHMTWECPSFLGMSNYSHDICRYYNMLLKSLHHYCIIPVYLLYYYRITIAYSPTMDNLTNGTMASHNIYIYIHILYCSWGYPVLPWRNLDHILGLYIMLLWVIYHGWDLQYFPHVTNRVWLDRLFFFETFLDHPMFFLPFW